MRGDRVSAWTDAKHAPRQQACAPMSSVVEELRRLLGNDVVLLAMKRGHKGPSGKSMNGWQSFTAAKMREPDYLARLNHRGNIGVLLGHGLATIDIDHNEAVEPFLKLNPRLRETLRSRRKRGCNLWVRIKRAYPDPSKLRTRSGEDWGEWARRWKSDSHLRRGHRSQEGRD